MSEFTSEEAASNRVSQIQLYDELVVTNPELFQKKTVEEQQTLRQEQTETDEVISLFPLQDLLETYGYHTEGLKQHEDGTISLPVTSHFSPKIRIPEGYFYKGGAAKALLLRSTGINPHSAPRDIDLLRFGTIEPFYGSDHQLAQEFMKDDYQFGDGVEVQSGKHNYLTTRDFTVNEVYASDSEIIATPQCVIDNARGIIRLTDYERELFGGPGPKMLSKMLRLYSEGIVENKQVSLSDIEPGIIESSFISPFWLAVQLDRAYQNGPLKAQAFVNTLKEFNQIPANLIHPQDVATYLKSLLHDEDFYFRHAPTHQVALELQLTDEFYERYEDLDILFQQFPTKIGHGRFAALQ